MATEKGGLCGSQGPASAMFRTSWPSTLSLASTQLSSYLKQRAFHRQEHSVSAYPQTQATRSSSASCSWGPYQANPTIGTARQQNRTVTTTNKKPIS